MDVRPAAPSEARGRPPSPSGHRQRGQPRLPAGRAARPRALAGRAPAAGPVEPPLRHRRLRSRYATRPLDAGLPAPADGHEPPLRGRAEGAALMAPEALAGVLALLVTIYLFVALLFPERF